MPTLKQIIDDPTTPQGRAFALFIQVMILMSLVTFSLETLPDLTDTARAWLTGLETFSVLVFTVEYGLRVYVSKPKSSYIFSFFGIMDLAAILPFYLAMGVDLRAVRSFRLLRLFRIAKLARYNAAARRFHLALQLAKEEIVLYLMATVIMLYLAAVGIYYFESEAQPENFGSIFHCLWWAVTTLTTVGYGDVYPITLGGRIFTFCILFIGLGIISVPAGLFAASLSRARQLELDAEKKLQE